MRWHNALPPDDAKAMPTIGAGVVELRIWDEAGTFRVVYVAKLADAIYVLHCFQKKTQQTPKRDIELAQKRLKDLMKEVAPWPIKNDSPASGTPSRTRHKKRQAWRARATLMMSLTEVIRQQGMTQVQAAALFGVTQPRVSDLMRGKVNLFSLDTLIDMAATAGMEPTVKVSVPQAEPAKRAQHRAVVRI